MVEHYKFYQINRLIKKRKYGAAIKHIDLLMHSTTSLRKCVNLKARCLIETQDIVDAKNLYKSYYPYAIADQEDILALKNISDLYETSGNKIQHSRYSTSYQLFSKSESKRAAFIKQIESKSLPIYLSFLEKNSIIKETLEACILDNIQTLRITEASVYLALANRLDLEISDEVLQEILSYSQAAIFSEELNKDESNKYCVISESTHQVRLVRDKCLVKALSILGKKVYQILPVNEKVAAFSSPKNAIESKEFRDNITIINARIDRAKSDIYKISNIIKSISDNDDIGPVLLFGESEFMKQVNEDVEMRKILEMYFRHFEEQPLPRMDCLLLGSYLKAISHIWGYDVEAEYSKKPSCDFSIIIPVRNSTKYLREVIETCLEQDYKGSWEVLISDNGWQRGPDVHDLFKSIENDKVRYIKTPSDLKLNKSFEYAFLNANGRYLLSLGSDDGLVISALSMMKSAFDRYPDNNVVFWPFSWYYWPDCNIRKDLINKLQYVNNYSERGLISELDTKPLIRDYALGVKPFFDLPMMYLASCVRREHIEKIIEKTGKFEDGQSQDIYTGMVTLFLEDKITYLNRPLVIVGSSEVGVGMFNENPIKTLSWLGKRLKNKYNYFRYENYHFRHYRNLLVDVGLGPKYLVFREYFKVSNLFKVNYINKRDIIIIMKAIHKWLPSNYGEKAIYFRKLKNIVKTFGELVYLEYLAHRMLWSVLAKMRKIASRLLKNKKLKLFLIMFYKNIQDWIRINKKNMPNPRAKVSHAAKSKLLQDIDIDLSSHGKSGIKSASELLFIEIGNDIKS
jgi:glycosyltransferase involved in cell wall biosynthesis